MAERYQRTRSTGANIGTQPQFIKHDEITVAHTPTYTPSYGVSSVTSNLDDANSLADDYLDLAEQRYQVKTPQMVRYAGTGASATRWRDSPGELSRRWHGSDDHRVAPQRAGTRQPVVARATGASSSSGRPPRPPRKSNRVNWPVR